MEEQLFILPSIRLTKERKEFLSQKMVACNQVIAKIYNKVVHANCLNSKIYSKRRLRRELFDAMMMNKEDQFLFIPSMSKKKQPIAAIVVNSQIKRIQIVQNLQPEILSGFSRLIANLAHKAWKEDANQLLTCQDYYNEGVIGTINAIYNYEKSSTKFFTYLYNVLVRTMYQVRSRNRLLGVLRNNDVRLKSRYDAVIANSSNRLSFYQACEIGGFTPKEIKILSHIFTICDTASVDMDIENLSESPINFWNDATEKTELTFYQKRKLYNLIQQMTDLEKTIFFAYLKDGSYGWQTRICSHCINPKNGKTYTPSHVSAVFQKAINNLRLAFDNSVSDKKIA